MSIHNLECFIAFIQKFTELDKRPVDNNEG